MNKRLRETLDKVRGIEMPTPEDLANFINSKGIHIPADDLSTWGWFLTSRFGRYAATSQVPEWLSSVFRKLIEDLSPTTICDPWAGIGLLIGILRETPGVKESTALTQDQGEFILGRALVPETNWHLGEPLNWLSGVNEDFDVVASILPMNLRASHPLTISDSSGRGRDLKDDLGNLILVAACLKLRESGIALFVVTPSFFFSQRSIFRQLGDLGIGIEAAFALPSGTFAPVTNIPAYLVVARREPTKQMFVAQLSADTNTNEKIIDHFKHGREGGTLELGRIVDAQSFTSLDAIRTAERFAAAEQRFGAPAVKLEELAIEINLGRFGEDFSFPSKDNAIFVPLIGNSDVRDSVDDLSLKKQNYAQVVVDAAKSNARFVARFLNSEFGKELREQNKSGAVIPKLNKQTLKALRVFVPDLQTQRTMLEVEARIASEQNTLLGLQNELGEYRRELWASPQSAPKVNEHVNILSMRLSGGIREHTDESLEQWFETLPFPLASILRAWRAAETRDFKTKHEHLLHFFEATAEFISVILLSAFSSNEPLFASRKQKLIDSMRKQNLSFQRATFGTWKFVVEHLGKQTRELLSEKGKSPENSKNDRLLCADMFSDSSLVLPESLSRKELATIISATNKMRNDWTGHGGVVGQDEAQLRNEQLLGEVQKLREVTAETWAETQLVHARHCRPRRGVFENEVSILMGSNNEFVKETRSMATWLDVERLYLSNKDSGRALKLLPLVQVGPSPESAKNACYFFSRVEPEGARFVSYHFAEKPELRGHFDEATEAIRLLTVRISIPTNRLFSVKIPA